MNRLEKLRIRQLDDTLNDLRGLGQCSAPEQGWVRTIRQALGMSIRQLAVRTELSKTSVASIESSEAKGTVQLDSLNKLAEGLNCRLVYALVPKTSLGQVLSDQAVAKATILVDQVSDSMDLEMQGVSDTEKKRQVLEMAEEMLRSPGRGFWNV